MIKSIILSSVIVLASANLKDAFNQRNKGKHFEKVGQSYPFMQNPNSNDDPVIGVMTQPLSESMAKDPDYAGVKSYMMVNYAQFLEAAGARVVPIIYGNPLDQELAKLSSLNGLLYPGGDADIEYHKWGKNFFDQAKKLNDQGTYFPVWGTCQGFQNLAMFTSDKSYDVLGSYVAMHINLPIKFLENPSDTKMFAPLQNEARIYEQRNLTFNAHNFGVSVEQFAANVDKGLNAFFKPIATSIDVNGLRFVSAMEAYNYPFYGIQFHPEKTIFSWYPNANIKHDSQTVYYNRYFADFMVNEARKNAQVMPGDFKVQQEQIVENQKLLIVSTYDGLDYVFM